MDLGGLASLITAIAASAGSLYAGWKFLKRQAREDVLNEDARKAVEAKNLELAKTTALNVEKDRTIAAQEVTISELTALLEQATRPEGRT